MRGLGAHSGEEPTGAAPSVTATVAPNPARQYRAYRPWISQTTLQLIKKRDTARANNEYDSERLLTRQIKNQVKADRASWLDSKIPNHDWAAIRKLKSKPLVKSNMLKD